MKHLKLFILVIFLCIYFPSICFSQQLRYGDLFEYAEFNWNKNIDDIIDCNDFFVIADTVTARVFINHDCSIFPNIKGWILSVEILKIYPKEAEQYQITGYVKIRALIDRNGNLYCYSIKTELGDLFIKQAESILKNLTFEKAVCNDKPVAYMIGFQVRYEYPKGRKEKKLDRLIKKNALKPERFN
jgi:hypothetical protein